MLKFYFNTLEGAYAFKNEINEKINREGILTLASLKLISGDYKDIDCLIDDTYIWDISEYPIHAVISEETGFFGPRYVVKCNNPRSIKLPINEFEYDDYKQALSFVNLIYSHLDEVGQISLQDIRKMNKASDIYSATKIYSKDKIEIAIRYKNKNRYNNKKFKIKIFSF